MGEVFLGHDPTLERDVALKLLHRDTPSGLREEAKALAALRHPSIVTIFEIGEHAGRDFIAMEYLPGRSLRQLLDARATPRGELLALCAQVARAVGAAHRAGILHRDIKPENIVVGDGGEVKVVDFGIARRLARPGHKRPVSAQDVVDALSALAAEVADTIQMPDHANPATQTAFGTPAYMAPELLHGEPSSEASDVYSLGVVVHECLTGRRPYPANSLVDLVIQVLEGPPAVLDDPLGALVAAMLARDPAQRPTLEQIAVALTPAERRRRWWPLAAAGAVAAAAAPIAIVVTAHSAPAPVKAAIAIAKIPVTMPSYGQEAPHDDVTADLIAQELGRATGAKLTAFTGGAADDPDYLVTGAIAERDGKLEGRLAIARTTGAPVATVTATRPSSELPKLVDALAAELAHAVAPAASIDFSPDTALATTLILKGKPLLEEAQLGAARTYYEQAVDADPSSFDARYGLAIILYWADASEQAMLATVDAALAHAPKGPKRGLVQGFALVLRHHFAEARTVWLPLEHAFDDDPLHRQQLMYFLGEAYWHDGFQAEGYAYFKRALEGNKNFRLPAIHAMQYAQANRDVGSAHYFAGLLHGDVPTIEFAGGAYAQLASAGDYPSNVMSLIVLGQPVPAALDARFAADNDGHAYRIARALVAGDRAGASAVFAEVLARRNPAPAWLEYIGEVLVVGGMERETRQLLALLAVPASRGRQHRLASLAGAAFHDPTLFTTGPLNDRDRRLRASAEAELAGDRAKAAELLQALVADPTLSWDFPERAQLLGDLRALHRTREAAALCDDTARPAIFRAAFLLLQRACRVH